MKKSLRDVEPKLEVHKAEYQGKPSGYIPGVISDIIGSTKSSIDPDSAINVLVGSDRFDTFSQQIERAKESPDDYALDPSLINIQKLPRSNEEEVLEVSATSVRKALQDDDKETVKKLLDPHVTSDSASFDDIYSDLRDELGVNERSESKDMNMNEDDLYGGTLGSGDSDGGSTTATSDRTNLKSVGGEKTIVAALKASAKLLKGEGVDVSTLKVLGQGEMGIAYDMGNGKVLKITTDESEAMTSASIKGKKLNNIVQIDDVWKLPNTDPTLFALISEKLTPLSNSEQSDVDFALQYVMEHDPVLDALAEKTWDEFSNTLYSELETDTADELGVNPESPAGKNKIRKVTTRRHTQIINNLKEFSIDKMVDELRANTIQFADYKGENLMKRGNDFVINDLGASKVENEVDVPVLETIVKMVMDGFADGLGHTQANAQSSQWSSGGGMFTDDETDPSKTER